MRNRLGITQTSPRLSSEGYQEEPANSRSGQRTRQRDQATGPARKRRKTASEGHDELDIEADQELNFTTSTASSSTRLPVSEVVEGCTASILHNDSPDAPLRAAVSYLQNQDASTRSPALHRTAETSHIEMPNTPSARQETQAEQYTSKAKRLVSLHSRKYF
jgi:hypothetical protein